MEYKKASADMADGIFHVLQTTIKTVYPKYYPKEVVDFFCEHHSREHILEGIASGNMSVLADKDKIIGTGCFHEDHITGVYVLPEYQKQGYGMQIINHLECAISKKYKTAVLDASLPAVCIYERHGYKTVGHGTYCLKNDVVLVYEIMEKRLSKGGRGYEA